MEGFANRIQMASGQSFSIIYETFTLQLMIGQQVYTIAVYPVPTQLALRLTGLLTRLDASLSGLPSTE